MIDWLMGIGIAFGTSLTFRWAIKNVPKLLVKHVMVQIKKAIAGKGIKDDDVALLVQEWTLSLVAFAEKKIPDKGYGPQRMKLIMDTLVELPWVGSFFSDNRKQLRKLIHESIIKMDKGFKTVL